MGLLAFLILLPIIVFIHEFGHFIFARLTGVQVDAFSIGFGKALFTWKDRYGTDWKISMIPLGGYVKMAGQSDLPETAEERKKYFSKLTKEEKSKNFEFKNRFQKILIIGAGPLFNFILGFLIFVMLFFFIGRPNISSVITEVVKDTPAYEVGLKAGDKIVSINSIDIKNPTEIKPIIDGYDGKGLDIIISREGSMIELDVNPKKEGDRYVLGIMYASENNVANYNKLGFTDAIKTSYNETTAIITTTFKSLGEILTGSRSSKELGGIISIAKISGSALSNGLYPFLYLMALLSISLGLFNLFPIPVLDGGHLFIYTVESIIRRDIPEKIKEKLFFIGFLFIIFLMLLANINDIIRLFQ